MAKSEGTPIIVAGMHRSGTSVVANVLHRVGISMGYNLLKSDQFNPNGYFEDTDFLWINKGIIENADGIWYDPPSVEELIKGGKKFKNAIHKAVVGRRTAAGRASWGWKDPRNCLTCWSYAEEVPDAKVIVVVRNLSDIKVSLNKTHGYLADWNPVIDAYYSSIENFLNMHTGSSLNISYEELIYEKYARDTVRKILNFVNRPEQLLDKALSVIWFG